MKWPARASGAIRRLFEPLQDIDVYVEDAGDEAFYSNLLRRLGSDKVRIERVFALHGRTSVIQACALHKLETRRALFIIDGDLEFVKGEDSPIDSPLLFRLDAYCIENLILCDKAIAKILMEDVGFQYDEAVNELDLHTWREFVRPTLTRLFSVFAASSKFNPSVATVSNGIGAIIESHRGNAEISISKMTGLCEKILLQAYQNADAGSVESFINYIQARIDSLPEPLDAVSGKDYLLPLMHFRLQAKGCDLKRGSLRRRLGLNCELEPFANLLEKLKFVAKLPRNGVMASAGSA